MHRRLGDNSLDWPYMLETMANRRKPVEPDFTVQAQPKVEKLEERKRDVWKSSLFLSIVKVIVTFFLFFGFLATLVVSKLAIVGIGQQFNAQNCTLTTASCIRTKQNEAPYIIMVLVVMVPQCITFMTAFASSAFSKNKPWPTKTAMFWGITSAVFEVVGLCFFTMVVATQECNTSKIIIYMNGIYFFPIGWQLIKQFRKHCTLGRARNADDYQAVLDYRAGNDDENRAPSTHSTIGLFFSFLLLLGGIAYAVYRKVQLVDSGGQKILRDVVPIIVFMLTLSFAWCPKVRKLQICAKPEEDNEDIFSDGARIPYNWQRIRVKTARERVTVITSLVKLCLTPLVAVGFAKAFQLNVRVKYLGAGFKSLQDDNRYLLSMLVAQVACSFFAKVLAFVACTLGLQKICFALPLMLSTPLSILLVAFDWCNALGICACNTTLDQGVVQPTVVLAVLLWLAQFLSTMIYIWQSQQFLMAKESTLFWLPGYDGVLIEQSLILNRKNEATDDFYVNYRKLVKDSTIYICTTMYHEADFEMEQLLYSINGVDSARKEFDRDFESHIFLDDGVRGTVIKWYALQLISLLPKTLNVSINKVGNKYETPYGMQLRWRLPSGMPFVLHLKDNMKVKNKKRWSQVMYMSYVLDFRRPRKERRDDATFILTTDADIRFRPNDVAALMDLMIRNPRVGAVCGRTRPMGAGPLVWYQTFDYAVGHWFLKVANHVFGSVLCSPGCFSVYRATALRDVLPLYSTGIDSAMDFLTKDMGEDRWLCTLMVEAGWRLEYCAAAENSTYCPDNFDEFFKQRRRWGPSTIANQALLINQQVKVRQNNDFINLLFILYQIVLLISTIIGPATVMLIVGGGLTYSYKSLDSAGVFVTLFLVVIGYVFICLKATQQTQLKVAKLLTFVFAVVMSIAIVGIILKTVRDVDAYLESGKVHSNATTTPQPAAHQLLLFSSTTWYLFFMIAFFFLTALLHGFEFMALIHGLWYLLCLPSGYLLLNIYSVANLTDRSWGTREAKAAPMESGDWTKIALDYFKHLCWCCIPPSKRPQPEAEHVETIIEDPKEEPTTLEHQDDELTEATNESAYPKPELLDVPTDKKGFRFPTLPDQPAKSNLRRAGTRIKKQISVEDGFPTSSGGFKFPGQRGAVRFAALLPRLHPATSIEDWLPISYQNYVQLFKDHGYDNVSFVQGIKDRDLKNIGIENRGHRNKILGLVQSLPPIEIEEQVPENIEDWLANLGLDDYWEIFKANSYTEPSDLAHLKYIDKAELQRTLNITKEGHLRKLASAVDKLQYPSKAQLLVREAREKVDAAKCEKLENEGNGEEAAFWAKLREICLLPEQAAFNQSGELKEKLAELRDVSLAVLVVGNTLWLTFMLTVMNQGPSLQIMGADFASVAFLIVYFLVLLAQMVAMVLHRCETCLHLMARTPFKPGKFIRNWSFNDEELPELDPNHVEDFMRRFRNRKSTSRSSSEAQNVTENGAAIASMPV